MSKIYAQKKPHETAGVDSTHHAAPAFSNQAMLDILKAPENVRAKPLSQEMNEKMSQHFGVSLSGIKVFENENLNQLGETAFAHGNEIHVAKGQYAPGTAHGQEVLMHEAAHVVQQGMGMTHGAGPESAALEAQAQSGGIMGSAATFSMPTATAAAPVQAFGGGLWKKIKGLFSKAPKSDYNKDELQQNAKIAMRFAKPTIADYGAKRLQDTTNWNAGKDGGRFAAMRGNNGVLKDYYASLSKATSGFVDSYTKQRFGTVPNLPSLIDPNNKTHTFGAGEIAPKYGDPATPHLKGLKKAYQQNTVNDISNLLQMMGGNQDTLDAINTAATQYEQNLGEFNTETNPGGLTGGRTEALHRAMNDVLLRTVFNKSQEAFAAYSNGDKKALGKKMSKEEFERAKVANQFSMSMVNTALTMSASGSTEGASEEEVAMYDAMNKFFFDHGLAESQQYKEAIASASQPAGPNTPVFTAPGSQTPTPYVETREGYKMDSSAAARYQSPKVTPASQRLAKAQKHEAAQTKLVRSARERETKQQVRTQEQNETAAWREATAQEAQAQAVFAPVRQFAYDTAPELQMIDTNISAYQDKTDEQSKQILAQNLARQAELNTQFTSQYNALNTPKAMKRRQPLEKKATAASDRLRQERIRQAQEAQKAMEGNPGLTTDPFVRPKDTRKRLPLNKPSRFNETQAIEETSNEELNAIMAADAQKSREAIQQRRRRARPF